MDSADDEKLGRFNENGWVQFDAEERTATPRRIGTRSLHDLTAELNLYAFIMLLIEKS